MTLKMLDIMPVYKRQLFFKKKNQLSELILGGATAPPKMFYPYGDPECSHLERILEVNSYWQLKKRNQCRENKTVIHPFIFLLNCSPLRPFPPL